MKIYSLEDIMNMTKDQIKALTPEEKSAVIQVLRDEIEKIMQRNKK